MRPARLSSGVAVDLLVQGREPEQPPREGRRLLGPRVLAAFAALAAVVAVGAVQVWDREPGAEVAPSATELLPPLPRVLLTHASVTGGRPGADGVLRLSVRLEGVPRAQLLSLQVELPGSAVVLAPLPDRLSPAGEAELRMDVLPRCPDALLGLPQAAMVAAVRGRAGSAVRLVRVRVDTAGVLADTVRRRCGQVPGAPALAPSLVVLAGPSAPDLLATQVQVAAAGPSRVTVVAVRAGPGLAVTVRTPLPLVVEPEAPPVALHVDLSPDGCGGAPDTPPYVLVLADGQTVALSVGPSVRRRLDALRPYVCAG